MAQTIYGICNAAYHNTRYDGDVTFYRSRDERDSALDELRDEASSHGLSQSGCSGGIFAVELDDDDVQCEEHPGLTVDEWLEWYSEARPGFRAQMLDQVGL